MNSKFIQTCLLIGLSIQAILPLTSVAEDSTEEDALPGLSLSATITNDTLGTIAGGVKKRVASSSLIDLVAEVDTEKAGLWNGGRFYTDVLFAYGANIAYSSGVLQPTSSIDNPDETKLFEAYYEHQFNDAQWRVAVGLQNSNMDFYVSEYAGVLVHSSPGMGPELTQTGMSTFPTSTLGIAIKGKPSDQTYVLLGAYDGLPGHSDGSKGTHVGLHSGDGYYFSEEFGLIAPESTTDENYYKLAFGAWQKTTRFEDFAGTPRDFAHGFYSFLDKSLYHENDSAQGLGMFLQGGFTNGDRFQINTYFGGGLTYTGLIEGRDEDVTALGIYRAGISNDFRQASPGMNREETAFELTYQAKICDALSLQPDVQFIHNPGATQGVQDAWVVGLRTLMSF